MSKVRNFSSPIEMMLRNAICNSILGSKFTLCDYSTSTDRVSLVREPDGRYDVTEEPEVDERYSNWDGGDCQISMYGQVCYKSYRFDLLILVDGRPLVIECDGHDWHDRTKQQAAYDRSRDRELLIDGFRVMRFTGSEIHHSEERCVADVLAVLDSMSGIDFSEIKLWEGGRERGREDGWNECVAAYREHLAGSTALAPEEHW